MIALDTNILVQAHRRDAPWHERATEAVHELAEGRQAWAIPWPCVHEFLAVATHAAVWSTPTPASDAWGQVEAWLASPTLSLLAETEGYAATLAEVLDASRVSGARIHDARVAALCLHHGVDELWTADRDFQRFTNLRTVNPLVD